MRRIAQLINLRPEKQEEYLELHRNAWPGVLQTIQRCNIRNYSIYLRDGMLFAYFEYTGTDYAADMARMAADPTTQDWWAVCKPCQQPLADPEHSGSWWTDMEEIFHFD